MSDTGGRGGGGGGVHNGNIVVVDEIVINRNFDDETKRNAKEQKRKIVYTGLLYFCFISVGMCSSIFNPTLVQLSTIFGTNLEQVSFIFPLRAVGCTVGTLTNGLLTVYFNRQILLIAFLILKALTTFLVPHWTSVHQFYVNGFFNGFFTAAIVVIVNVWLNELWSWSSLRRKQLQGSNGLDDDGSNEIDQKSSKIDIGNVLMQGLHFFFGIGTILGPILAEPFLRDPFSGMGGFLANCLVIPYTIAAAVAVLSSISFFVLFVVCPYEQPDNSKLLGNSKTHQDDQDSLIVNQFGDNEDDSTTVIDLNSNSNIRNVSRTYRYLVIAAASFFIFVFLCSEGVYFQFSASFATKTDLHLSEPNAALLASSLAISFTVFRALSVLIALKLSPETMILLDLVMVSAGNTLVFFFANHNLLLFGGGFVLLGAGFASVFPSMFPFIERHGFVVTDWVGSLLTFSGGVSQILAPFLIGLYIDTSPFMLVYFTYGSVGLAFVALFALNLFIVWSDRSRRRTR